MSDEQNTGGGDSGGGGGGDGGGGLGGWLWFILIFGVGNLILYNLTGWYIIPIPRK